MANKTIYNIYVNINSIMNIALIGSGGREHALCQKIYESKISSKIFCIPGNAGTVKIAQNIENSINQLTNDNQSNLFEDNNKVILGAISEYLSNRMKVSKDE